MMKVLPAIADWEQFRDMTEMDKTVFVGEMRVYAVKVPQLLHVPEQMIRLCRLYSGNKTALTIK